MEDPNYNRHWKISKLFDSKEIKSHFYRYIEKYPLTDYKQVNQTTIKNLKSNIEDLIKTHYDDYNSITREDLTGED